MDIFGDFDLPLHYTTNTNIRICVVGSHIFKGTDREIYSEDSSIQYYTTGFPTVNCIEPSIQCTVVVEETTNCPSFVHLFITTQTATSPLL